MTEQNLNDIWKETIQLVWQQNLEEVQVKSWFLPLNPKRIENNTIVISCPNPFTVRHFDKNKNNYGKLLQDLVYEVSGIRYNLKFIVEDDEYTVPKISTEMEESRLNPKYIFDTFVIGQSNQFAHAASLAVAENPIDAQANPLFIYGGVGLGKTHLMHAIGHFMLLTDPSKRVLYVTSEQFTNEFISSIRNNTNEDFRRKYRSVDLLLIDDIQFIADKESTMDEFFHTFNELHSQDKQIVMTSDKPPKDIKKLEQRLISRFAWGLVVDIQPPDLETRIAILRNKAESDNYYVPDEVINYIANHVKSNIRQLEGALSTVIAYSRLMNNMNITEEMAAFALKDFLETDTNRPITVQLIKEIICQEYQITMDEMDGKKRNRSIAYPRQIAMYLTRTMTNLSLPKIGSEFGGRDHSTIIHATNKIKSDMDQSIDLTVQIEELKKKIEES